MSESLLALRGLRVWFPVGDGLFARKKMLHAVEGVDLEVRAGEALGGGARRVTCAGASDAYRAGYPRAGGGVQRSGGGSRWIAAGAGATGV